VNCQVVEFTRFPRLGERRHEIALPRRELSVRPKTLTMKIWLFAADGQVGIERVSARPRGAIFDLAGGPRRRRERPPA